MCGVMVVVVWVRQTSAAGETAAGGGGEVPGAGDDLRAIHHQEGPGYCQHHQGHSEAGTAGILLFGSGYDICACASSRLCAIFLQHRCL